MKKNLVFIFIPLFLLISTIKLYSQLYPIRIACVGNSITYGGMGVNSYPQQLDAILGDEFEVKNFGVSGTTMLKHGDLPYWTQTTFFDALDFDPDIIIILLGTNDSKPQNWIYKEEFFNDYMDMISVFRESGKDPVIYVGRPCPAFQLLAGINGTIIREEILPLVDSVQTTANTLSIDYYNLMLDQKSHFPDGVHPDAAGYKMMAEFAAETILNMPSGQILKFVADQYSLEKHQKTILRWRASAGSVVKLNGATYSDIDSVEVEISATTDFTLIAEGETKDSSTITLKYFPPGKIKSFYADPPMLEKGVGDTTTLHWETANGSIVTFGNRTYAAVDSLFIAPENSTVYSITTSGDISETAEVAVKVVPADSLNRALMRPVITSSTMRGYQADWAVDGNPDTYWMSQTPNSGFLRVQLAKSININRVVVHWGDYYGVTYRLQIMDENGVVTDLFTTTTGDGGIDDVGNLNGYGNLLRLLAIKRNSPDSGYVIREVEIYGTKNSTAVDDEIIGKNLTFNLEQNYPNPFNPSTNISYNLAVRSEVKLTIYNLLGETVKKLVDEVQGAGMHEIRFDAEGLSSGMYFYELKTGNFIQTKKMLLVR